MLSTDELYMQRCLQLAKNATGNTYPNPLVGSVIVYDGKIIGEGYHRKAGEPHAEINAINSVKDKSLLKKSTLYVNLEPCSHYGKTPPCAAKIASLKIPRVVVGTIDTTAKVNGKGIKIMSDAGIDVSVGVLREESRQLNKRFFTFYEQKRPYIILKWAMTIDGFVDIAKRAGTPEPYWITGKYERTLVHKWRSEEQAIMVGKNTVIKDNPELTTRNLYGTNPLRVVVDTNLSLSNDYKVFNEKAKTIVFNTKKEAEIENIQFVRTKSNGVAEYLKALYEFGIQSIIIEGGPKLLNSFLKENLWDEARVFVGRKIFGTGIEAPKMPSGKTLVYKFDKSFLYLISRQDKV